MDKQTDLPPLLYYERFTEFNTFTFERSDIDVFLNDTKQAEFFYQLSYQFLALSNGELCYEEAYAYAQYLLENMSEQMHEQLLKDVNQFASDKFCLF